MWRRLIGSMLAIGISVSAPAQISVDNFAAGDLVRYPVVLLRGHANGDSIAVGRDWDHAHRYPVEHGEFRALVELKPGINMVVMQAGRNILKFRLDYRPASTSKTVRAVWVYAPDEATGAEPQIVLRQKFDTALKLVQCFYAEAMHEAGRERKTFALELDKQGSVVVHFIPLTRPGADLRAMDSRASWQYLCGELGKQFPEESSHWCTLLGFLRYDPATKTVAGNCTNSGGSLAACDSASVIYWPKSLDEVPRVFHDSTLVDPQKSIDNADGRHTVWSNASTSLGALTYELGVTFGLRPSGDALSVMSREFDGFHRTFCVAEPMPQARRDASTGKRDEHVRWSAEEAAMLFWNPYFQPDFVPLIQSDGPKAAIQDDIVTLTSKSGIRLWVAEGENTHPIFEEFQGEPKAEIKVSVRELRERLMSKLAFRVTVIDSSGRSATIQAPAESGPPPKPSFPR